MQCWEYCHLNRFSKPYTIALYGPSKTLVTEVKRDKSKGDGNDDDAYQRTIAELGLNGWEAVGHLGQTGTILFKRLMS